MVRLCMVKIETKKKKAMHTTLRNAYLLGTKGLETRKETGKKWSETEKENEK